MLGRRTQRVFAVSLAASVMIHAGLLATVRTSTSAGHAPVETVELAVMIEPPAEEPPEVQLGIDAPNPPSPTWLGFEQPEEQLAPVAEVEQAAFSPDAAANNSIELNQPPAPPQALADAMRDGAPIQTPPRENTPEEPTAEATEDFTPPALARPVDALAELQKLLEMIGASAEIARTEAEAAAKAEPERQPDAVEQPKPAPPPAASPVPPAVPTRKAIAAAHADKESAASSTIDVPQENWKLGKPMAAGGLELKTRRPEMTTLTLMTSMPANPTFEVAFRNDGVPVSVYIKQSSGDQRVDAALVACLYRWRASGERLDKLVEGETITITLRLLLSRQRAA